MNEKAKFQAPTQNPSYYGRYILAPYACQDNEGGGRLHDDIISPDRSDFQHDCDRIIHSAAFRRLQGKTQVFIFGHRGDHFRNRASHTQEVTQLAESIARQLGLNPDLAKAVAMSHDLGHPPFGHAGEHILQEVMQNFGGFDHNAHSIDIVTRLEAKRAEFNGLNLSWATLEGIAKHNGPVNNPPRALLAYNKTHDLRLSTFASGEAQVAAYCDDIAYNNHDIEDGLRSRILTVDSLINLPLVGEKFDEVMRKYPEIEIGRLIHEAKRRIMGAMVKDLVSQVRKNLQDSGVNSAEDIRGLGRPIAHFSPEMQQNIDSIRAYLHTNLYRNEEILRKLEEAKSKIAELFKALLSDPSKLPSEWKRKSISPHSEQTAQNVCDYIAGMTDEYALNLHKEICSNNRTTRR